MMTNTNGEFKVKVVKHYQETIPDCFQTRVFDALFVTDSLSDEIEKWDPGSCILLEAPTGKGKNTFINKCIVQKAIEQGKRIALFTSRVATEVQQKKEIIREYVPAYLQKLTDSGIQNTDQYDSIIICTYQKLQSLLRQKEIPKEWIENVAYAVFDECHFFVSDCLFNRDCDLLLQQIPRLYRNATRIYMTATPEDVFIPLSEAEFSVPDFSLLQRQWYEKRYILHYQFLQNYSKYNVRFFNDDGELIQILQSSPSDEKWLIFISNKEEGRALHNILSQKYNCGYLDADLKGSPIWEKIIEDSIFEQEILITTSVLDCGVNIKDSSLKNIVIVSDDKTEMFQMLGRKRCTPQERVNVWIRNMADMQKINTRHFRCVSQLQYLQRFNFFVQRRNKFAIAALIDEIMTDEQGLQLNKLFYMKNGELQKNSLAEFKLMRMRDQYASLLKSNPSFKTMVRSWFHLPPEEEPSAYEELLSFCGDNVVKPLDEHLQNTLRRYITEAYQQKGFKEEQPTRTDSLKYIALNNRLEKLQCPYRIYSDRVSWILQNHEWEKIDSIN